MSVDQTLRKANALAKKGATGEAAALFRAVLDRFPDNRRAMEGLQGLGTQRPTGPRTALTQDVANQLLAIYQQGRFGEALAHAENLAAQHPDVAFLHNIAGASHAALGQPEQAAARFRKALALTPNAADLHSNLGDALNALRRPEEAITHLRKAVALQPDLANAHNNLGNAHDLLGQHDAAAAAFAEALRLNPRFAQAHRNLGVTQMKLGELQQAAASLEMAIAADPGFADAHSNLGLALARLGRPDEGARCCRRAIELNPRDPHAQINLAVALEAAEDWDGGIDALEQALALQPDNVTAHSNLCEILDQLNRVDAFRAAATRARDRCGGGEPLIAYRLAQLAARDKDHEAARGLLQSIPDDGLPPALAEGRLTLLGKTCDKLGDFAAAFDCFTRANDHIKATPAARQCDPAAYRREIEDLTASFAGVTARPWTDAPPPGQEPPVFLVGFPRSGTTLLDTILRSHPQVTVVEEMPMAARMQMLLDGAPDRARLAALGEDEIAALRTAYFDELGLHTGDTAGTGLVIDKLPLNIVRAGLINRVFPDAKFIFAGRHPCDCVLSCYMQNFKLNNAMATFLDLEASATLYDRVMQLWTACRDALQLDVHTLAYEDLVRDMEATVSPLLAFMGLDWDDGLRDYRKTALTRGRINTPSYNQVTEKLYKRAAGRWENYRAELAPVLPLLQPWAEKAGY